MNLLLCDGVLSVGPGGEPLCSGAWSSVAYVENSPSGMTPEDYVQLKDGVLILFAIVFGILALKKAIQS